MKSSPLIGKITILFLILIVIAFSISAGVLVFKSNIYIEKNVERSFQSKESQIVELLNQGVELSEYRGAKVVRLHKGFYTNFEQNFDTLMESDDNWSQALHRVRRKVITVDDKVFEITMKKNIADFSNMKADITSTLIPVFVMLALLISVSTIFLSRILLKPFNQILDQMKKFRVGDSYVYHPASTTTKEFILMQKLYQEMIGRAQDDYQRLKEYTENMSHELQTPLSIIRNKTEYLIADEDLMQNHEQNVKTIYHETHQLSRLSSTLKLLTKIENHEYARTEIIYTKPILEGHTENLVELAGLKSVVFDLNLDENHHLKIDPFLLEIMLKNLLRNAILYSKKESEIKVETIDDQMTISNFSESDADKPEDVFKRFSKGGANKSSLGLGLAIVKKICDLNGLTIEYKHQNAFHQFIIAKNIPD